MGKFYSIARTDAREELENLPLARPFATEALDKEKAVDGERAWARTASWAGVRSLRPRDTPRRRIGKSFLSQRYGDYGNSTRGDGRHVRAVTCNDVKTCL